MLLYWSDISIPNAETERERERTKEGKREREREREIGRGGTEGRQDKHKPNNAEEDRPTKTRDKNNTTKHACTCTSKNCVNFKGS